MQTGKVLWIATTGLRCSGRTEITTLAKEKFESLLPEQHPEWTFEFLKSPLADLPLPLLHEKSESPYARVKMLRHWGQFYQFIIEQYLPLVERANQGERIIALSDGSGHDAAVDATAYTTCSKGKGKALALHHTLVHHLLVEEQVPKPLYYNLTARTETIDSWMLIKFPELTEVDLKERLRFIEHQVSITRDYFDFSRTGQLKHDLCAETCGKEELAEQIYHHATGLMSGRIQIAA